MIEDIFGAYKHYFDFYDKLEAKERHPYRLFASDVGKCPRSLVYRFRKFDKDPISENAYLTKRIMFSTAEAIESELADALSTADMLVDSQRDIPFPDKYPNWGARLDFVVDWENGERGVIELKTVHPNAFRYDLWWPEHHHQANIYHIFLEDELHLTTPPNILYMDRGGQNQPQMFTSAVPFAETLGEMDHLTKVRDDAEKLKDEDPNENLPPRREKVLKLRSYGKKVMLEPHHNCMRCDYANTCNPDLSKSLWAEKVDGLWRKKAAADPDKLEYFIETTLLSEYEHSSV